MSFRRVFEVLDLPTAIEERPDAIELTECGGGIDFDDVWFSYGEGDAEGLDSVRRYNWSGLTREDEDVARVAADGFTLPGLSFQIAPGDTVALVGPSGAGKRPSLSWMRLPPISMRGPKR